MKILITDKVYGMIDSIQEVFQEVKPKAGKIIGAIVVCGVITGSLAGCGKDKPVEQQPPLVLIPNQTTTQMVELPTEEITEQLPTEETTEESTTGFINKEEQIQQKLSYPFTTFELNKPKDSIQTFDWTNTIKMLEMDPNFQQLYRGGLEHLFPHLNLTYALAHYFDEKTGEAYYKIVDRYGVELNNTNYHGVTGINAYTTIIKTEDDKTIIFDHNTGNMIENIKEESLTYKRINNNYFYTTKTSPDKDTKSVIYDINGSEVKTYNNIIVDSNRLYLVSDAFTEVVDLKTNQAQKLEFIVDKVLNKNIIYHNLEEENYGMCYLEMIGVSPEEKITPKYNSLEFFGEQPITLIASGIDEDSQLLTYAITTIDGEIIYTTDSQINKIETKQPQRAMEDSFLRPKQNYAYINYYDKNIIINQNGSYILETSSDNIPEYTVGNMLVYRDNSTTLKTAVNMETEDVLAEEQKDIIFQSSLGSSSATLTCLSDDMTQEIVVLINNNVIEKETDKVR